MLRLFCCVDGLFWWMQRLCFAQPPPSMWLRLLFQHVHPAATRLVDVCFHCVSRLVLLCVNPAPQQQIIPSFGSVPGLISAPVCLLCGLAWGPVVSSFVGLMPARLVVPCYCIFTISASYFAAGCVGAPVCFSGGVVCGIAFRGRCKLLDAHFSGPVLVCAAHCRAPWCRGSGSSMAAADFQQRPRVGVAVQQLSRAQTWLCGTPSGCISPA